MSFALTLDGKMVAALCRRPKMSIHLWDTVTGKEMLNLPVPDASVRDLSFSPDSKILALAGDVVLLAWDVSSGKLLWEHHEYRNQFFCVAFSPDSKTLAAGFSGGVRRYDAATGQVRPAVKDDEWIAFLGSLS